MSLLGVDIGGSSCKAVAFDALGRRLAAAAVEYPTVRPRAGWLEFDTEVQWRTLRDAVCRVAAADAVRDDPVTALGISAAGDAVVPVDGRGRPLAHSIAVPDPRGGAWVPWWHERLGARRIFEITGQTLDGFRVINRLLWYRAERPEVFAAAWKFLCWEDLLLVRLGLPPVISPALAARTMAYDLRRRAWSAEILDAAEIAPGRLADPVPAGTPVGEIAPRVATDLGLPAGVVAVTGGYDAACAALGAGLLQPGDACICTGSVEAILVAVARIPDADALAARNLSLVCHATPEGLLAVGLSFAAGSLLRWYRDELGAEERRLAEASGRDPFAVIAAAVPAAPTDLLVLPHFAGSFTPARDPAARGAILGLSLGTTRAQLLRALLEGTAFEAKLIVEAMIECGLAVGDVRAVGGGARSRPWLQIKADVLDRDVQAMREPEAGCLGAAILAASATGVHPSLAAATTAMTATSDVITPCHAALYAPRFAAYRGLHAAVAPFHDVLSAGGPS